MDAQRATQELTVIRQLMERPVRYSTMSGLSGIIAGIAAMIGLIADSTISERLESHPAFWANVVVWAGVFVVAFLGVVLCTRWREKQQNMPFWSPVKARILRTILPPFVAGVGLTLAICYRWYVDIGPNLWGLIPAIWMAFYGVALWQVGEFSIPEVRIMGAVFILSALVSAAFFQYAIPGLTRCNAPYWTLGISFGGYHIIYGFVVWARYGG